MSSSLSVFLHPPCVFGHRAFSCLQISSVAAGLAERAAVLAVSFEFSIDKTRGAAHGTEIAEFCVVACGLIFHGIILRHKKTAVARRLYLPPLFVQTS